MIRLSLEVSGAERTVSRKERKILVFPHQIIHLDWEAWTSGDVFIGSGKALEVFAGQTTGKQESFNEASWSLVATSTVKKVAALIQSETAISGNGHLFFTFLNAMTKMERQALMKYGWNTRTANKNQEYELSTAAFVNFWIAVFGLMMLKSKVRIWIGQCDPNDKDVFMKFDENDPNSWPAKLYQTHYGGLTGDDLTRIIKTIKQLERLKIFLPKECFIVADKLIGWIEIPYVVAGDEVTDQRTQRIDFLMTDPGMSDDPKLTNTEDTNVKTVLENISLFFNGLAEKAKELHYRDEKLYTEWLEKYAVEKMTTEWLMEWPKMEVPWIFYYLRTHKETTPVRYEFISIDYSSDYFITKSILTRKNSDLSDEGYDFKIRTIPGFDLNKLWEAIIFGYFFMGDYMDSALAHDGDYQTNQNFSVVTSVFQAVETIDQQGVRVKYHAHNSVPVLQGDNFTEDSIYGIFSATDNDPVDKPLKLSTAQAAAIGEPTSAVSPLVVSSSNYVRTTPAANILKKLFPELSIDVTEITADKTTKHIFDLMNPVMVKEADKPPVRQSKISGGAYADSDDPEELNKYINDLEAEIVFYRNADQPQQVTNREKTIERVKAHLKDLSEKLKKEENAQKEKEKENSPADIQAEATKPAPTDDGS